ncbi:MULTISPECIES: YegP family protein [Microbacterium]|uniref:YegP family protein n=1 Tax=Microbacterium resistens TaxID=156977 RepID=A0ABY3RPD5_9MICO|nr:YegP family protein [Microbacterium resistens]MBW1641032.1 YegP family protein [Microbacterium resistens]MDA4892120.1 YegP family protein [Streptomyces sp. MS2A]UGS25060.1 YegP family protein [Microbacterium resistens]
MAGKFELYQSSNGEWRFRLKAGNGEVIATGEGYASKSGAVNGIDSVRRNAADAEVVEVDG